MDAASKDIILFSTADWDNPFWTNKQHMALRLAERGYRILYVDSLGLRKPTGRGKDIKRMFSRLAKGFRGLQKVHRNIRVFSPLVIPAYGHPWIRQINNLIIRMLTRRHIRQMEFQKPVLWTYNPLTVELAGRFNESMIIYHCVDDLTAAPGMPLASLVSAEEKLVRAADLVFTSNPTLQETRSHWNPDNTYYFPNVADFDHFSKARIPGQLPSDLNKIPHPRIGFIGAISSYKIDFDLITYIAETRKDWQWVMIGQIGEGQPETSVDSLDRPNIHFLGPRPYQALPDYLRGFDVAVLPSRLNNYTSSMFPMKFFEYLSAGKPVVATDLPALRDYENVCVLAKTPDEFIEALQNVFDGNAADINLRLQVAQENTWNSRLDKMEKLMSLKWEQKYGT